jgi:hypothetical protein
MITITSGVGVLGRGSETMKVAATSVGAVILLSALAAWPAAGDLIEIDAELYTDSHDIAGSPIVAIDYFLWGLDHPGEWTDYAFEVSLGGTYSVHVLMRGDDGVACTLRLTFASGLSGGSRICEVTLLGTGMT